MTAETLGKRLEVGETGPERRGHESILLAVVVPSHPGGGVPIVTLGGRMAAEAVLADFAGRPAARARAHRAAGAGGMVRAGALLAALLMLTGSAVADVPPTLPPLAFEDQVGRALRLDGLRGQVAVIVYGNRDAMDASTAWGRRLEADLVAHRAHAPGDPLERRPVRILAFA